VTPAELKPAPRAQTDEELAVLAGRGDAQAFAAIVDRHSAALLAFARTTAGAEHAEDVLQQSLMQAWSALRGGAEVGHVRGWLFQIVRRASWAASQSRVCSELPLTLASSEDVHASIEQRLQLRRVVEQVGNLPRHQRIALVQTAVEGRSRAEVAASLGVTEGAVRQLLHRGRERIRQAAAGFIPLPLWRWLLRGGDPEAIAESGRGSVAAVGLLGTGTKAVLAMVSVGALAAGTGAEIHHLRQAAHVRHAAAVQAASSSSAPSQLAELFTAPGAPRRSVAGTFAGGGPGLVPAGLPGTSVAGVAGPQPSDGQQPSSSSSDGGPAAAAARPVSDQSSDAGSGGASPATSGPDHAGHGTTDPAADATPGDAPAGTGGTSRADPSPADLSTGPADGSAAPADGSAPQTAPDALVTADPAAGAPDSSPASGG
jgi:RNA polymerase sigma factor (sigma-70 family)